MAWRTAWGRRILLDMTSTGTLFTATAALALLGLVPARAASQTPTTGSAFWPAVEAHAKIRGNLRLLALAN